MFALYLLMVQFSISSCFSRSTRTISSLFRRCFSVSCWAARIIPDSNRESVNVRTPNSVCLNLRNLLFCKKEKSKWSWIRPMTRRKIFLSVGPSGYFVRTSPTASWCLRLYWKCIYIYLHSQWFHFRLKTKSFISVWHGLMTLRPLSFRAWRFRPGPGRQIR